MCDCSLICLSCGKHMLCGISTSFPVLFLSHRQVTHALLTRPPLTWSPKLSSPFDLNVLCTPPAFILSQDQTLWCLYLFIPSGIHKSFSIPELSFCSFTNYFFEFSFFPKEFLRVPSLYISFLICSLFNFQGSFRQPLRSTLEHYITYFLPCQVLF